MPDALTEPSFRYEVFELLEFLKATPDAQGRKAVLGNVNEFISRCPLDGAVRSSKEVFLEIYKDKSSFASLQYASDELRGDKDFVLALMKSRPDSAGMKIMSGAAPALLANKAFVFVAIGIDGECFRYASEELRGDERLFKYSNSQDRGWKSGVRILEYASDTLRGNKECVLAAVSKDSYNISHAPDQFKNDKEVMAIALAARGGHLFCASPALKNDRELVLEACEGANGSWGNFMYAGEDLKRDRDLVLRSVRVSGLKGAEAFYNDAEVVLAGLRVDIGGYWVNWYREKHGVPFMPEELRTQNKEIVMVCIERTSKAKIPLGLCPWVADGSIVRDASEELRSDLDFLTAAVEVCRDAYAFVPEMLRTHERVLAALAKAPWKLKGPLSQLKRESCPALHQAACNSDVAEVLRLLAARADPNEAVDVKDAKLRSLLPLHLAASVGSAGCALALLEAGASPSTPLLQVRLELEQAGPQAGQALEVGTSEHTPLQLTESDAVRGLLT